MRDFAKALGAEEETVAGAHRRAFHVNDPRIDWKLYPRLAGVFQFRHDDNVFCAEFRALLDAASKAGTTAMLAHLERTAYR